MQSHVLTVELHGLSSQQAAVRGSINGLYATHPSIEIESECTDEMHYGKYWQRI